MSRVPKGKQATVKTSTVKKVEVKPEPVEWRAEDYVTARVPVEEIREVKSAFDIFDTDATGRVDSIEVKNAFISLGYGHSNKLLYNIMQTLDTDFPDGMDFEEFLSLSLGKMAENKTRANVERVFVSMDFNRAVGMRIFRGR